VSTRWIAGNLFESIGRRRECLVEQLESHRSSPNQSW
jgi:hypothetical protein